MGIHQRAGHIQTRKRTTEHTDNLVTEEVLARLDATRDGERHLALVCDELVDGPRLTGEAVFVNLEPLQAGDGALGRVGDFCAMSREW